MQLCLTRIAEPNMPIRLRMCMSVASAIAVSSQVCLHVFSVFLSPSIYQLSPVTRVGCLFHYCAMSIDGCLQINSQ